MKVVCRAADFDNCQVTMASMTVAPTSAAVATTIPTPIANSPVVIPRSLVFLVSAF